MGIPYKSGYVGVLGQTNVGKSTFLNAVMGQKLLITSPKPQTTRNRVRCVLTTEGAQIVFVDTPGLHRPQNKLGRYIVRQAFRAVRGLDLLVYVVEPWRRVGGYDSTLLKRLTRQDLPILLLVNKIDLARGNDLEETLIAYEATGRFSELIPISALKAINLDEALRTILSYLPERKAYFPSEVKIDQPEEFLISELIREKIIDMAYQEIPYTTATRVKWLRERQDGMVEIKAEIVVERESQKGIIIGKGGRMIKRIGTLARAEIESLLGTRVFLELVVKVQKGWSKDLDQIKQLADGDSIGQLGGE
ncbi:MAG TPA: GTPase Era [Candidatus Heimdallarchaeota archaeon]|nr:GTPase Era [Candidatus Heimdallarchaeota archaeon]